MATSARAQKEAYLRRKNLGPKTPRSEEAPIAVAPKSPRDPDEKTWQEKRKDNLLSRARGGRVRETHVGIAAVMFASKLKRLSSAEVMQQKDEKKKKVIPLLHPAPDPLPSLSRSPSGSSSRHAPARQTSSAACAYL